ncbi:MAG: iron complex outermembrane recepter [Rhodospirillaceae bacterium]|nr:MAG: iron complex outermembrane recepter [Rhodospirillaceae bacterium]TNC95264.1 MAG: iron complex outermembrane recepter protein [Stygiobacter sp.]
MVSRGKWVAALMMTTALTGVLWVPAALAQTASVPVAAVEQRSFDISAQPLADALPLFGRQAGLQVSADAAAVGALASPGVKGSMSAADALRQLLDGTGATWRFTDARTVVVERVAAGGAMQLAPVTVSGASQMSPQADIGTLPPVYAGGQVARGAKLGILGNRDVMDTPFTSTSYTAELIQNQQARTLADVLENDASVRFTTPGGHVQEQFNIRGFDVSASDTALNGMFGLTPSGHVPMEFVERVEVLRGPAALLTGMAPQGSVGGLINLVPKRAGDKPQTTITADYTSGAQFGGHVDAGRRFGADNQFGARVNAVHRDGETGVDGQEKESNLAALALDYRGDNLRLSFDGYLNRELFENGQPFNAQVSNLTALPDPPDSDSNMFRGIYGQQEFNAGLLRGEYDFNDNLTAYASFGLLDHRQSGFITSTHALSITSSGSFTGRTVYRRDFLDTMSSEAGLRSTFQTGDVGHQVVLGMSRLDQSKGEIYNLVTFPSNLYNPSVARLAAVAGEPYTTDKTTLSSVALADTLSFMGDKVQTTLGIRRQEVDSTTYNSGGVQTANYNSFAFTPALGVVVKPVEDVSVYANYIEGLIKGQTVTNIGASNYGATFAPFVSKQLETGVKWEAGKMTNTLALFEIKKNSMSNVGTVYMEGQQRNRGVEWNIFGEVVPGLRALGGISYIDSKLIKHATATLIGKEAYGVPNWRGNLGLEWDIPMLAGLTVEGRAVYTGQQYANSTNTLTVPEWWRFDIGARYTMDVRGTDLTVRAYATNIFDTDYWASSFSDGMITLSEPRTFMLATSVTF